MRKLIESSIASLQRKLVLVAPSKASSRDGFTNVTHSTAESERLIHEMQRLRGAIYLDDGAVTRRELTADGRHATPEDHTSWHLLMTDTTGHVRSCALYLLHERATSIQHLRVRHCPLLQRAERRHQVQCAIESEMARAQVAGLRFAELGGWAISKERRGSPDGLMMALAAYGLARMLGGAIGITAANAQSSSLILRRLGGSYLAFETAPIPSYFDPRYNTEIDLLRFDSRAPSPRYAELIDMVMGRLATVSVFGGSLRTMVDHVQAPDLERPVCAA
jgi:hypothetical protein